MRSPTETRQRTSVIGSREPAPGPDVVAVGTVTLVVLGALTAVLTALAVHDMFVTECVAAVAILICVIGLMWFIMRALDRDRRSLKRMVGIAHMIEGMGGGVAILLLRGRGSRQSLRDLERFLEHERLSVVRLGTRATSPSPGGYSEIW